MRRRFILRTPLFWVAICTILAAGSSADSSWEVRRFADGSGILVDNLSERFLILGDFEGAMAWQSTDGGFTGAPIPDDPFFPVDSIVSLTGAYGQFTALDVKGDLWRIRASSSSWYWRDWVDFPDSLGKPTTIFDTGPELWLGTEDGGLFRRRDLDIVWQAVHRFGPAPVRQIASRGSGRPVVVLGDGSLFVQDSVWVEAPIHASLLSLPAAEPAAMTGHILEKDTHHLWKTADGGMSWSLLGTALTAPEFAPWIGKARKLIVLFRGLEPGLGLIPCEDVLLASDDAGLTWRIAASGTGMFLDAAVDDVGRGDILTAGSRIHRSTDRAFHITQIVGGDFGSVVMGSPWTLWSLDRGLLLSVDRGSSWQRQPLPERAEHLRRIAARGEYEIWLHFEGSEGCRSYYSSNRGIDLESLDAGGMLRGILDWSFPHPGIGWAITDSSLLHSEDDGLHWQVALEGLPGIDALATRDSIHAAVCAGNRIYLTRDGGVSWNEGTLPNETTLRGLAFSGADTLVGAGRTIVCLPGDPPWNDPIISDLGDTLHGVAMADGGRGWTAGSAGLLAETADGGCSWSPYRSDLEINALRCRFPYLSAIGSSYAVTGSGATLLLLGWDGLGPSLRIGISMNPYLARYLDIHITAHELLLEGSLTVAVDDEETTVEPLDPEGFLYRARYRIPRGPDRRVLIETRGEDLHGNLGLEYTYLTVATIDRTGIARLEWDGNTLDVSGSGDDAVVLKESGDGNLEPPRGWMASGRPFQIAIRGESNVRPVSEGSRLAGLIDGAWELIDPVEPTIRDGAILWIVRDASTPPVETTTEPPLHVFPLPANEFVSIEWGKSTHGPLRWEIVDAAGRRVNSGVFALSGSGLVRLPTIDSAGRPMAAGVYWLRVRAGASGAARRILVAR